MDSLVPVGRRVSLRQVHATKILLYAFGDSMPGYATNELSHLPIKAERPHERQNVEQWF